MLIVRSQSVQIALEYLLNSKDQQMPVPGSLLAVVQQYHCSLVEQRNQFVNSRHCRTRNPRWAQLYSYSAARQLLVFTRWAFNLSRVHFSIKPFLDPTKNSWPQLVGVSPIVGDIPIWDKAKGLVFKATRPRTQLIHTGFRSNLLKSIPKVLMLPSNICDFLNAALREV